MKNLGIEVLRAEIMDECERVEISDGEWGYLPSAVSVIVNFILDGEEYELDFQTDNTQDYGAISSSLWPYDNEDHDELQEKFWYDFAGIIEQIKEVSQVDKIWSDYIDQNYVRDTDNYGGMDANSEFNAMVKKSK